MKIRKPDINRERKEEAAQDSFAAIKNGGNYERISKNNHTGKHAGWQRIVERMNGNRENI